MLSQTPTLAQVVETVSGLAPTLKALGVARLRLFGSIANGTGGSESDVDLLVTFAPGMKTYDRFDAVAELLELHLGRPVDLVTEESLSPFVGPHILREATDVLRAA